MAMRSPDVLERTNLHKELDANREEKSKEIKVDPKLKEVEDLKRNAISAIEQEPPDLDEARRCAARLWILTGEKNDNTYVPEEDEPNVEIEKIKELRANFIGAIAKQDYNFARGIIWKYLHPAG